MQIKTTVKATMRYKRPFKFMLHNQDNAGLCTTTSSSVYCSPTELGSYTIISFKNGKKIKVLSSVAQARF